MARARWMRIRTFGSLEKVPAPVAGENIRALGTALAPRRRQYAGKKRRQPEINSAAAYKLRRIFSL